MTGFGEHGNKTSGSEAAKNSSTSWDLLDRVQLNFVAYGVRVTWKLDCSAIWDH
jgi:hypothetical protein